VIIKNKLYQPDGINNGFQNEEIKFLEIEETILEVTGYYLVAAASGLTFGEAIKADRIPLPDLQSITVALYATLIKMSENHSIPIEDMMCVVNSVLKNMNDSLNGVEGPKRNARNFDEKS
jgi:hypothetical protein